MTRRTEDLRQFAEDIRKKIYPNKVIHRDKLRFFVAQEFGYSDYVQKSTLSALLEFGFMKTKATNIYEISVKK